MTFNVGACLKQKSREGIITTERAVEASRRYAQLRDELDDAIAAGDQLTAEYTDGLRRKQWTRLNEVRRQAEAIARIERHRKHGATRIARSFFEFLPGQQIGEANVYREFEGIRSDAHALIADAIDRFAPRAAGLRNPAHTAEGRVLEEDIVRELFGETTGNKEAKALSKSINEGLEYLRVEFNRAGGNIDKREDFGLPQQHDPAKVEQVSRDEWVDTIMPLLDREKMIDLSTGMPFSDSDLRKELLETYDVIVSRGLDDMDPTNPKFGQKLTTRHQHRRFLQFSSPDKWLEYQRQFGPGNGEVVFTVSRHIETMGRDIAAMRVLGPNPQQTVQLIGDTLKKEFKGSDQSDLMQNLLRETTGKTNAPVNEQIAGFGIGVRNILNASILGGAFLSALSDVGFSATAAKFAGIPMWGTMSRHMKLMNPANAQDRRQAIRLGLGAQGAVEQAQAAARVSGEALGDPGTFAGKTRQINDFVMRASLLQPWSEAARWAFGTEVLATITERADLGEDFARLPEPLRNTFERNGIDAAAWDTIRASDRFTDPETNADFIRPLEVMKSDPEVARALQRMVSTETEYAVPSNFAHSRNALRFGTRPGTLAGEIVRSVTMLKNFPVTVLMLQWGRVAQQRGGLNKAKYLAMLFGTTGTIGVLAEQLSAVSDGRTPRPVDPATPEGRSTVIDGLWRAGSFGLLGDAVFTNYNRYGSSLGESLAGPAMDTLSSAQSLTFGNVVQALRQEKRSGQSILEQTDIGRDAVNFAQQITPGNNLWWAKLAWQRLIWDQLQVTVDPEYGNSFDRVQQIAEEQGTEFFFKPQPLFGQR